MPEISAFVLLNNLTYLLARPNNPPVFEADQVRWFRSKFEYMLTFLVNSEATIVKYTDDGRQKLVIHKELVDEIDNLAHKVEGFLRTIEPPAPDVNPLRIHVEDITNRIRINFGDAFERKSSISFDGPIQARRMSSTTEENYEALGLSKHCERLVDRLVNMNNDLNDDVQGEDPGGVLRSGREILLQAFNWNSHKYNWWSILEGKVPNIAESGFTSAWLPPATRSISPEGYLPENIYSLNSAYGSENQLKALLKHMKQHKVRAMTDIVINYQAGTVMGHGGMYRSSLSLDERGVTSCSGRTGNHSTGVNFHGVADVDHTQDFVREEIIGWLLWLCNTVGFQDFRFDFARGYAVKYVKEYIERTKPIFSAGGYWDSCNYSTHGLDYNQDSHRQQITNWIDGTGKLSTAFDFTTKGILQEAVKGQLWRLRDPQGKPPGVIGWRPTSAVTFIDDHDTGSTQAYWPFPSDHIMEGYAYILTHPGIPTVFYDHFYDWGDSLHNQILKLMGIRRSQDIRSQSSITILEAQPNLYSAIIGEKVCMKIGDGSWCPAGKEWTLATSGHRYAVWHK